MPLKTHFEKLSICSGNNLVNMINLLLGIFCLGFTPYKAEQPLLGMELRKTEKQVKLVKKAPTNSRLIVI